MESYKKTEQVDINISTPWDCLTEHSNTQEKQSQDIKQLSELIERTDLIDSEREEIYEHAFEAWTYINPNSDRFSESTKRNVYRYQSVDSGFSDEFYETNWDHSCKMINGYTNLERHFPDATKDLDSAKIIKMILWHDAPEFLYGDMSVYQQTNDAKQAKVQRENEAIEAIKSSSYLGDEIGEILEEYEIRESKEAVLVKVIDILAGQDSYINLLYDHIPSKSAEIESLTGLKYTDYLKYLVDDQYKMSKNVFNKWMLKYMKHCGLDNYGTALGDDYYEKTEQMFGKEYVEKAKLVLQTTELKCDNSNPSSRMIHHIESTHSRCCSLVSDIQYYIDSCSFESIEETRPSGDYFGLTEFYMFKNY